MIKSLLSFIVLILVINCVTSEKQLKCSSDPFIGMPTSWRTMVDTCIQKMRSQVEEELTAAMTYLAMGAHFSRDKINRLGFAHFFFESASEERKHAIKIMEYLLMRGELVSDLSSLIHSPKPLKNEWNNGAEALIDALELETKVTGKINEIIKECETPKSTTSQANDYHLVDYLTGEFLTEQYHGQRDLAGKISNLGKMMKTHGALGEFLFDKKLLKGEV